MSSKITINKDLNKRKEFVLREKQYRVFRMLSNDLYLPTENRHVISHSYIYKRYESIRKSYVKNRCILSGRSRSVYSFFKMTRMIFKNLAVKGDVTGLRKNSW